jgi:putative ABC transport system substrate-binding protein
MPGLIFDPKEVYSMKKFIAAIMTLALLAGCAGGAETGPETVSIGILQHIDHPALDAARNGFINGLAEEGWVEGENVSFYPFNAQGDISNAQAMAQQIVESQVDLILGITTPSSQTLAATTDTIPIVITAVTDPLTAGLIDDFVRPGTNVTGTSDLTPVAQQFELLVHLLPEARVVGIMYNAGEINSYIQANMAMEQARLLGLEYIEGVAPSTADVAQVTESIIERVDVIYIPTCNTMAAAYSTIVMIAEAMGVPVIAGEEGAIPQGALATEGINYYNLGRQTAVMAGQILRGESTPQEMPIQWQAETTLIINTAAAERLGIDIPADLLEYEYTILVQY